MRELTQAEKLVFGADAQIDEVTGNVIEQGNGAVTSRDLVAQRTAQAEHSAEHERLQKAEATLTERLAEAHEEREQLIVRAEAAEAAHAAAVERAEKAEAMAANPSTTGAH